MRLSSVTLLNIYLKLLIFFLQDILDFNMLNYIVNSQEGRVYVLPRII